MKILILLASIFLGYLMASQWMKRKKIKTVYTATDAILTMDEHHLLGLINNYQNNTLSPDGLAQQLISDHCETMAKNQKLSHHNYPFRSYNLIENGATKVSEILAYGYTSTDTAFKAFLNSESHKKVLDSTLDYDVVGVSIKTDTENRKYYGVLFVKI